MTDYAALIAEAQIWDKQYRDQMIAVAPNSMVGVMLRLADALVITSAELTSSDRAFSALKSQHAKSDVALVDAKAEIARLEFALDGWENDA